MTTIANINAQETQLDFSSKVKAVEHQLDDIMELTDSEIVKSKLEEVSKLLTAYSKSILFSDS